MKKCHNLLPALPTEPQGQPEREVRPGSATHQQCEARRVSRSLCTVASSFMETQIMEKMETIRKSPCED